MFIETNRLIIRDLIEQDAEALLEIKYDKQVMKYHPAFFGENATIDFIKVVIAFFQSIKERGVIYDEKYPERGCLSAVCLKDSGVVIGVITFNQHTHVNEWHIGWYFLSRYTGQGYASEAGAAASDYFLEAISLDYISADVRDDNPASFRTAQKSGFKLIEKRIGFDYDNPDCNVEDVGSCSYYFQKLNKNKTRA
ncbi:Acetyltransferase (GNAT) family protein [compost metagenome]